MVFIPETLVFLLHSPGLRELRAWSKVSREDFKLCVSNRNRFVINQRQTDPKVIPSSICYSYFLVYILHTTDERNTELDCNKI